MCIGWQILRDHVDRLWRDSGDIPVYCFISPSIASQIFENFCFGQTLPEIKDGASIFIMGIRCIIKTTFPPDIVVSFSRPEVKIFSSNTCYED